MKVEFDFKDIALRQEDSDGNPAADFMAVYAFLSDDPLFTITKQREVQEFIHGSFFRDNPEARLELGKRIRVHATALAESSFADIVIKATHVYQVREFKRLVDCAKKSECVFVDDVRTLVCHVHDWIVKYDARKVTLFDAYFTGLDSNDVLLEGMLTGPACCPVDVYTCRCDNPNRRQHAQLRYARYNEREFHDRYILIGRALFSSSSSFDFRNGLSLSRIPGKHDVDSVLRRIGVERRVPLLP